MKVFFTILGVLIVLFVGAQIYFTSSQDDIEMYPYEVVKEYDAFEVRQYESSLFTTVKLGTNEYEKASSEGFSVLAGYIFGGNDRNEKIAMTSPVAMSMEDSMTMMFMVPKDLKKESLPTPNNNSIEFQEMPPKTVAAIRFGGWADSDKIAAHKKLLVEALEAQGIPHTNEFYVLGYNPPFELINRRNEVIVVLSDGYKP
ncbi:MAG: heme-binding protein [Bacteroidota bacterium]